MTKSQALLLLIVSFHIMACGQEQPQSPGISPADSLAIRTYEQKSIQYQRTSPDSAVFYAEKGLQLSRKLGYRRGEASMLDCYARINEQYGNLTLAIKHQRESLAIFTELEEEDSIARTTAGLGLLEGKAGNIQKAIALIRQALRSDENRRDTAGIITSYTQLGEVMEQSGRMDEALVNYNRAKELSRTRPLTDDYYRLLRRIGRLHNNNGEHQKALGYLEEGIKTSSAAGHGQEQTRLLRKAAETYDSLGNKQQAISYHQQSIQKARELNLPEEEARSLMGIASAEQHLDAEQSIVHLKNALAIARSIGHKQLSSEIYYSLANVYNQQSRYNEALAALNAHHRLVDSLQNRATGHRIAALQSSYALAESKLRVEALEITTLKQQAEQRTILLSLAAILLLLSGMGFYFYRIRRLNRKLESSNQIKDKLFSIIGHDLRNPIGGITQLLALMEDGDLSPDENQEMVTEMRKQGDVTLEILNALLNWGEAQIKGIHIRPSDFRPKEIIQKNIDALHKQAADKALTITDVTPPDIRLHGDSNHFDFVIRNLISNAIKFSHPGGTIRITAENTPGTKEVIFSVKDDGKGITKEQLERFRSSDMDITLGTRGEKGTGIGLTLSKEFIVANHGRMWAESEESKGATFYFTFGKA